MKFKRRQARGARREARPICWDLAGEYWVTTGRCGQLQGLRVEISLGGRWVGGGGGGVLSLEKAY